MSNNRCSNCYESGHNRRKCPLRAEQIKNYFKEAKEFNLHYRVSDVADTSISIRCRGYGREYASITGLDIETGKPIDTSSEYYVAPKVKKCSYCTVPGHTRRTCKAYKEDRAVIIHLTKKARRYFVEEVATGCGIGSLNHFKNWTTDSNTGEWVTGHHPYILTGYNWGETCLTHCLSGTAMFRFRTLSTKLGGQRDKLKTAYGLNLAPPLLPDADNTHQSYVKTVRINAVIPAGWLDIESEYCNLERALEYEFPKGRRRDPNYAYHKEIGIVSRGFKPRQLKTGSFTNGIRLARIELGIV
tara:strand:+ start:474 stop:1373 length:900 start_codon:yes stop_codon:yes gene_type:complete